MTDDLPAIAAFVQAAETGSLTEAARRLGLTASGVGKAVTRLERGLGVRLLLRTTRRVTLTAEGEGYLASCREALALLEAARVELRAAAGEPRGRLAVEAPVLLGRSVLLPLIPAFLARWPEVELRLVLNDGRTDFAADGVDAVIRTGALEDSALVARRLGDARWVVCGAPAWFDRHGRPDRPEALRPEHCLPDLVGYSGNRVRPWRFRVANRVLRVQPRGRLISNSCEALVTAASAGLGLAQVPTCWLPEALAAGRVEIVLEPFEPEPYPIQLVYPASRRLSPVVRAFADFVAEELPRRL